MAGAAFASCTRLTSALGELREPLDGIALALA
jgi:hypothetical protein